MLFAHLSAGDHSQFNPTDPLPQNLRPYEAKAFLSMVGVFSVFVEYKYEAGPRQELVNHWPNIRKWIHHFLNRALLRKESPAVAPITSDELFLTKMGDDWTVISIVSSIFSIFRDYNRAHFEETLANDGSFAFILKLWARLIRTPTTPIPHRLRDTLLLLHCLELAQIKGEQHAIQKQLLQDVGGDSGVIATFVIEPIRDAANAKSSKSSSETDHQQLSVLSLSLQLTEKFLAINRGHVAGRPFDLGRAFLTDKINIRYLIINIVKKYTRLFYDLRRAASVALRAIITSSFVICGILLCYEGSIDFAVHLLNGKILDSIMNLFPALNQFSKPNLESMASLLKHNIPTFLCHEAVISANDEVNRIR